MIAQNLLSNGFKLRYLNKRGVGELDFVIQYRSKVIALKVKSGKTYKSHIALNNALSVEDWSIYKGIILSNYNIEIMDKCEYLPFYMIMYLLN